MTPVIRNPYQSAQYVLWGLVGLFAIPVVIGVVMVMRGTWPGSVLILISMPFLLFCGIGVITWGMGQIVIRQIEAFLASDRPLLRWTYTPAEWQEIQDRRWAEDKEDWKLQLGGLTFIFGLVGLLVGLMGMGNGLNPFVTTPIGLAFGLSVGVVVAGGSHLAARQAYLGDEPCQVVLAVGEFFYGGQYFRASGDRKRIESVEFKRGHPSELVLNTYSWNIRSSTEDEWDISVPPRLTDQVEAILPSLQAAIPGEADS
jgi:hypothetical protein